MLSKKMHSCHVLLIFLLFYAFPSICHAGQSQYIYDDLGRLSEAVNQDGSFLRYRYDSVGNLVAIDTGVANPNPPTLNSINPSMFFIGTRVSVTITGSNLITAKNLITDPIMPISIVSISDTQILLYISVPSGSLTDTPVILKVTTLYGEATISATLTSSKLVFSPGQLPIAPGSSGSVTASIVPSVGSDLTINLNNSDPEIASAPDTLTIPPGGTATFDVTALQEGVTTIDSGDINTVVFVTEPFTPESGEEVTNAARPVSVYMERTVTADTTTSALPVSVYIAAPVTEDATASALPVSVYMEAPATVDATTSALPVSVYMEAPVADEGIVVTPPVSAQIGP